MSTPATYAGFVGTWILIPSSCKYDQGDPPKAGRYTISEQDGHLVFRIEWIDADDQSQQVEFSGRPDGQSQPFDGGELADAMSIHAVSPRELTSRAYLRGKEHMVAQRQLDETGAAMRVTQVIRFADGTHSANVAIYQKRVTV